MSRKLILVIRGLAEPSTSETTDNINTNDDHTQAVSMLFQTALNLKPYINKTIRLDRSTESRPRLLCVTLNSASDRKEVLANAKKLCEPQNQQFNQVYTRPGLTKEQYIQSKTSELKSKDSGKKIQIASIGSDNPRSSKDWRHIDCYKTSKHSSSHV